MESMIFRKNVVDFGKDSGGIFIFKRNTIYCGTQVLRITLKTQ